MSSIDEIDIKKQLNYVDLIAKHENDKQQIDSIIKIITDVMTTQSLTVRIAKVDKLVGDVIKRYAELTDKHVAYVLECIKQNTSKPRNIRAYLITALYNAPATIGSYYAAKQSSARADPEKQYSFDIEEMKSLTNNFST